MDERDIAAIANRGARTAAIPTFAPALDPVATMAPDCPRKPKLSTSEPLSPVRARPLLSMAALRWSSCGLPSPSGEDFFLEVFAEQLDILNDENDPRDEICTWDQSVRLDHITCVVRVDPDSYRWHDKGMEHIGGRPVFGWEASDEWPDWFHMYDRPDLFPEFIDSDDATREAAFRYGDSVASQRLNRTKLGGWPTASGLDGNPTCSSCGRHLELLVQWLSDDERDWWEDQFLYLFSCVSCAEHRLYWCAR